MVGVSVVIAKMTRVERLGHVCLEERGHSDDESSRSLTSPFSGRVERKLGTIIPLCGPKSWRSLSKGCLLFHSGSYPIDVKAPFQRTLLLD